MRYLRKKSSQYFCVNVLFSVKQMHNLRKKNPLEVFFYEFPFSAKQMHNRQKNPLNLKAKRR